MSSDIDRTTAVGAFDDRVYVTGDVARLGLRPLGGVRAFTGDNVGIDQHRFRQQNADA